MRIWQIEEEEKHEKVHCCENDAYNDNYTNLLEILTTYVNVPVGYAAFQLCPCGVWTWKYFYVLEPFRRKGIGLAVARSALTLLYEKLGNVVIESTHHVDNRPAEAIFRYAGFQPTYLTGVASVERILARHRDC
jgi:RimJ/RimL family protein N-acetyltransferase